MAENMAWWTQVKLDPALTPYITLSQADINAMTVEAAKAADPVAKLTELLTRKGELKRDAIEKHYAERRAADAKKIADPASWPIKWQLFVKTQPWETAKNGFRHGCITPHELTAVAVNGNADTLERFDSIEELVKIWSVD